MSILQYLDEKRYFLMLYAATLLFVALMMIVSADGSYRAGDVSYTVAGCGLLAWLYLAIGYVRRNGYCRILKEIMESDRDEIFAALPKPETAERRLYLELIKKLYRGRLDELKQLYDEKKDYHDFLMSWIHEVKLPITACDLLLRNRTGKSAEELASRFEDELQKIDHYVEQALYYSRIDSFSKDYLIAEVSLNQVVRGSVKKYAKLFIQKQIRFTMGDAEQWAHSDSKWLGYMIDQMLANALKYTPEGGEIAVRFEEDQKEKRLLVRDSGIGISPEDLDRVFERGFTGSTGRQDTRSTGMGLYLAKQLALKLGHQLSIRSEEGRYTEAAIHFPKVRSVYGDRL